MSQINEELSLKALDGNRELLLQLAQIFTEDAPVLLNSLRDALDRSDAHAARIASHSLKGLVSTFYVKNAAEIAHQVEQRCAAEELGEAKCIFEESLLPGIQGVIDEMKLRYG